MMSTDENVAVSVNDAGDNLQEIEGIGPGYAKALNKIGIYRFADFLPYNTPEQLQQALEEAGEKIPLWKIKNFDWLGQARAKISAQQANTVHTSPQEETEIVQEPQKPSSKEEWKQHAGFNLFFDFKTAEYGEQEWRTRVYYFLKPDDDFEAKAEFLGVETAPWVSWILEQVKLPVTVAPIPAETEVAAGPTPSEAEVAVPPAPVTPYNARIEILDVQVSEVGPSSAVPEKRLRAEVRFKVSGSEAETLTAERIPFRSEVHTVNLEGGASNLVASGLSQLQPQMFEYISPQDFPIPELGRYELHSIVLMLPPDEMMAYHRGPTFKVVP